MSRDHALLFEPNTRVAQNFLDGAPLRWRSGAAFVPVRIATTAPLAPPPVSRARSPRRAGLLSRLTVPVQSPGGGDADSDAGSAETAPFELEVVEAALLEVTGQLDTLLLDASARVASLLRLLPQRLAITAEVLEELRLVKQSLVELDSRAGAIRSLLLEVSLAMRALQPRRSRNPRVVRSSRALALTRCNCL